MHQESAIDTAREGTVRFQLSQIIFFQDMTPISRPAPDTSSRHLGCREAQTVFFLFQKQSETSNDRA